MVVVDVVASDKKGKPVTGLKADEFTVEENGKKQKIGVFSPASARKLQGNAPSTGILSNRAESVGPAGAPVVLLIDALNTHFREQAYGRSEMLKYVAEQAQTGRPMAVLALTDRLHVLQQFTSDPQVLLSAIRQFKPQESVLQPGTALPPPTLAVQNELASFSNVQLSYQSERRTIITLEAMRALARMLGGLPGRKSVVWLTADLPFALIPEDREISNEQLLADLPGQGRQRSLAVNAGGSMAAEQRQLHNDDIRQAESRLASANISIYPVDLRGLVSGAESLSEISGAHPEDIHGADLANAALAQASSLRSSQATLEEIAAETGGKAYINENEIKQGVALAAADDEAAYTIGYYPENKKWDGKYRNIRLKTSQGDLQLRYRRGYFALDPLASKQTNHDGDVLSAVEFNAPATQISFLAQAKPADAGKVRVVFLVDAHTIAAEDAGSSKKLDVNFYAFAFDSMGKSLGVHSLKVDRAFDAATFQQIMDKGMMVPLDMDLPAGTNELRLAILDNKTGYIGTARGPLQQ